MSTLADVFTVMGVLDNELDLSNGGADEARGIAAVNIAQHQFEAVAAQYPKVMQSSAQTVSTTASTEQTTFPSALLRLDALWLLDATTNLPVVKLKRITDVGGHVPSMPWPLNLALSPGVGSPSAYYANMADFYWLPLPQGANTIRIYGLFEQSEFTTRSSTFTYPNRLKAPIAEYAVEVMSKGLGDNDNALEALASAIFGPVCKRLKKFDRSEPLSRAYTYAHTT